MHIEIDDQHALHAVLQRLMRRHADVVEQTIAAGGLRVGVMGAARGVAGQPALERFAHGGHGAAHGQHAALAQCLAPHETAAPLGLRAQGASEELMHIAAGMHAEQVILLGGLGRHPVDGRGAVGQLAVEQALEHAELVHREGMLLGQRDPVAGMVNQRQRRAVGISDGAQSAPPARRWSAGGWRWDGRRCLGRPARCRRRSADVRPDWPRRDGAA